MDLIDAKSTVHVMMGYPNRWVSSCIYLCPCQQMGTFSVVGSGVKGQGQDDDGLYTQQTSGIFTLAIG